MRTKLQEMSLKAAKENCFKHRYQELVEAAFGQGYQQGFTEGMMALGEMISTAAKVSYVPLSELIKDPLKLHELTKDHIHNVAPENGLEPLTSSLTVTRSTN